MGTDRFELWFDFSCPYAYLASQRAPTLGVPIDWRPMLLGGVFQGIGSGAGPMATLSPQKAAHNARDLYRWAEVFDVPFQIPAAHPMRTVRALRVLLGLPHPTWAQAIAAIYAAYWQRAEDITSDLVITAALRGAGLAEAVIAAAIAGADSDAIKAELRARTDEAIALGIFGAPAWIIRRPGRPEPILVWGQDRMPWLEAIAAGWDPESGPPPGGPRSALPTAAHAAEARGTLDFYFDVASPYAYLGLTQVRALATGAKLRMVPILLGALFRDIGQHNVPLFTFPPPKVRYVGADLPRWARWWGVPFAQPTKFPQRTIAAQRLAIVAGEHSADAALTIALALGTAMWAEGKDLEDLEVLRALVVASGFPPEWIERTQEPAIKAQLAANTEEARQRDAFGVPSYVVDNSAPPSRGAEAGRSAAGLDNSAPPCGGAEAGRSAAGLDNSVLVWGQDRLDFVARALAGWRPARG